MILSVLFNYVAADKRDPMSSDDCEILDIQIQGLTVPLKVENDRELNVILGSAIHRMSEIMTK